LKISFSTPPSAGDKAIRSGAADASRALARGRITHTQVSEPWAARLRRLMDSGRISFAQQDRAKNAGLDDLLGGPQAVT
jgi:hypothetical protein